MSHHPDANKMLAALPPAQGHWRRWVVSGGGLGLLRPAPGSWGTVGPALIFWALLCAGVGEPWRSGAMLLVCLIASILLIRMGPWACAYFQDMDPGSVVLDEYAGFSIAALCCHVPPQLMPVSWPFWLQAAVPTSIIYLFFRLTDTLKLPPASQLERLPYGWGILCDDLAAGVQANLLWQLLCLYLHHRAAGAGP